MKKIILSVVAVMAFGFASAQSGILKGGAHIGLPSGDISSSASLNFGIDASYTWKVAPKFDAGVTAGYTSYVGKGNIESAGFIPVAGTAQYDIADKVFLGLDLGYAIYTGRGNSTGGVLYQPKLGYKANKFDIYAGYKGISIDGITFSSLNVGVNFKL
jgi:hypothetical protein